MPRKTNTDLHPHLDKHEQKNNEKKQRKPKRCLLLSKSKHRNTHHWKQTNTQKQQIPQSCSWPTCTHKLLFLHLCHVVAPQVWRGHALCVETQAGALSQPLGQPGHMAVALQVVGVQAAGQRPGRGGRSGDQSVSGLINCQMSGLCSNRGSNTKWKPLTKSWASACGWNWPQTIGWCCYCSGFWREKTLEQIEKRRENTDDKTTWQCNSCFLKYFYFLLSACTSSPSPPLIQ